MRSKFGYGKPLYINFIVFSDPANVEQPLGKEPFREPVSSIAVGCQLDPADPFLSVVLLSPVVLIMELSYLTVGHFECNRLPFGHGLSDPLLPIALRMDLSHWSVGHFECNRLHCHHLSDPLLPIALRMDLSHWSVGHFECNRLPHCHHLSDPLLPIALKMELSHWSVGHLECNRLPYCHHLSDPLLSLIQQAWIFQTDRIPSTHWALDICRLSSVSTAELARLYL